jgi:hypothetical protein
VENTTNPATTVANATGADSIFRTSKALATETRECKIVFIAPSKFGMRLIVNRQGQKNNEVVYVFPEIVKVAEIKAGMKINMLVEKKHSEKDNADYWNCTALAQAE